MIVLAIYDISSNKARKKISDRLLDIGLVRTQYSVFMGTINHNQVDEMSLFAEEYLEETDRLYIIPVHKDDLNAARIVGKGFDEKLVADEIITKVL